MRTTLTLDEDIAAKLKEDMRHSGRSFKETVNFYLRAGLNAPRAMQTGQPFVVQARALKPRVALEYDKVGELLEIAEGPLHK